jgi:hypothetical protein
MIQRGKKIKKIKKNNKKIIKNYTLRSVNSQVKKEKEKITFRGKDTVSYST